MGPHHAVTPPSLVVARLQRSVLEGLPHLQRRWETKVKCPVCLADGKELAPLSTCEHAPCRNAIQGHPTEHESRPTSRPILQHDNQVVPEVEVRLERAGGRKGPTTQVLDRHGAGAPHAVPPVFEAPTQIDLFHVGKQRAVKSVRFEPRRLANEKACARRPKHLPVLHQPIVHGFHGLEHATKTKWIPILVHPSTGGSRMFAEGGG